MEEDPLTAAGVPYRGRVDEEEEAAAEVARLWDVPAPYVASTSVCARFDARAACAGARVRADTREACPCGLVLLRRATVAAFTVRGPFTLPPHT